MIKKEDLKKTVAQVKRAAAPKRKAAPVKKAPKPKVKAQVTRNEPAFRKPSPPGGNAPPSHKGKLSQKQLFIWAEGQQESGGNYAAVNASSGALGRWQVMPSNLPGWLRESGLPQMTPNQYLANHKAQDKLAETILGGDFDKYGPAGAAAVWYSGQDDPTATYGDPPVYVYVQDVLKLMGSPDAGSIGTTGIAVPLPWSVPSVTKTDSWAAQVRASSVEFDKVGKSGIQYGDHIRQTYRKAEVT
jgi:hypothetical protein